jgi:hypothetical protein
VSAREDGWPVRVGQDPGSPRGPREGACARDLSAHDLSAHDLSARDHSARERGRDRVGHRQRGPGDEGRRRRVRAGADGRGRDYAGTSVRRRHCCAECAQRVTKGRPGAGGPGRKAAADGGRDAQGGRAQTAERIAGTEMIIALPGPTPSGETQVTAVAAALDQGRRGNNNEREGAGPAP